MHKGLSKNRTLKNPLNNCFYAKLLSTSSHRKEISVANHVKKHTLPIATEIKGISIFLRPRDNSFKNNNLQST